ncbi:AzlD domain-containing protein [Kineosporia sp. J2-2]|uniref:AzlD domain-containing protein n=1 Tax=Kineosporia corallincola TaxID=2835133 RepID=A0ABS5TGP3_9ACTN|nr:AzlD domain-containing protein [Kineosporia corallincola]MBT0770265.1 AzlD domain-containing protein [Kineosporia corallincola]
MTTLWLCIAATALVSFSIKAAGPALLGSDPLPERARGVVALLAPALLFALVVAELLGPGWHDLDPALVIGVTVAVVARLARVADLPAVLLAVLATALARLMLP